jgi:benzodiazapine receptor
MQTNYLFIPLITIMVTAIVRFLTEMGLKSWYVKMKLPDFAPSGKTISIVWGIIYALTAASAIIVWNSDLALTDDLAIIGFMLVMNALMSIFWTFLFFVMHMIEYALLNAAALTVSVLTLMVYTYAISATAALLLVPYLFWSIFIIYLTFYVWKLNPK